MVASHFSQYKSKQFNPIIECHDDGIEGGDEVPINDLQGEGEDDFSDLFGLLDQGEGEDGDFDYLEEENSEEFISDNDEDDDDVLPPPVKSPRRGDNGDEDDDEAELRQIKKQKDE